MKVSVAEAKRILSHGGVIAIPTETVYGLAADATNPKAVEKIFRIKNRPSDNPLICHFYSFNDAKKYLAPFPVYLHKLTEQLSPGPVSYMLKLQLPSSLTVATRGREEVIIRIPRHDLLLQLLREIPFPLAAPSANTSGKFSSTNAQMIESDLGDKIDGVLDGGNSAIGLESTILDCREKNCIRILRPGAVGKDDIEWILRNEAVTVEENSAISITTPGSKYKHYSPRTPLTEVFSLSEIPSDKKNIAVLGVSEQLEKNFYKENMKLISLGSERNLQGIASTLYQKLFELDALNFDVAYFIHHDWGESAMGKALNNRISHFLMK